MEARILSHFVDEWFEFKNVEICNAVNHTLAVEGMLSVRGWQRITSDSWLREVARARVRVFTPIVRNDELGARIAHDELWIILSGIPKTQMWRSWAASEQSLADRTRWELDQAGRLLLMIDLHITM